MEKTRDNYRIKMENLIPFYGLVDYFKRITKATFENKKDIRGGDGSISSSINATLLSIYNVGIFLGVEQGIEALVK